ncbi:hypothetical protein [Luteolibacter sp. AS25]|uniref:hypothetical protein n=1 Tax=Luteolibacter sp. AS25 TaxID=3135776 RepID=UPI00398ACA81
MPINLSGLSIRGSMRLQCDKLDFRICFEESKWIAKFSSFSDLMHARKEISTLTETIKGLPPLPLLPGKSESLTAAAAVEIPVLWVTIKDRPVGKLIHEEGVLKFRPTILNFFTKDI